MQNLDSKNIARVIKENDNYVICGHVNHDGDCIGSQCAFAKVFDLLGKRYINLLADSESVANYLSWLPGADKFISAERFAEKVSHVFPAGSQYTFLCLDVPKPRRMGKFAPSIKEGAELSITVDHHIPEGTSSTYNYIDQTAPSASYLVWQIAGELDFTDDKDIATSCLTGLISDTGSFMQKNADIRSFLAATTMIDAGADNFEICQHLYNSKSLAALKMESRAIDRIYIDSDNKFAISWLDSNDYAEVGACKTDTEEVINVMRAIDGVDFACILKQESSSSDIRGSLRSNSDIDVAKIANKFVGGGHKAAAGFTIEGCKDIKEAFNILKDYMQQAANNK